MAHCQPIPVNQTQAIDLSSSWDSSTVTFINIIISTTPINFQSLWHDPSQDVLYSFGGESSWLPPINGAPPPLSTWKFTPNNQGASNWSLNTTSSDPPFSNGLTRPFGGLTTSSNDTAFYLGGYSSEHSAREGSSGSDPGFTPTPGIVSYNFRNGIWRNDTATGYSQYGTAEWGAMQFISSLGPEGVLVVFGGDTSGLTRYTPGGNLRPMTNITIYEPRSRTWYYQNATGDVVPAARMRMCVVAAREQGSPSHEIFMYGGEDGTLGPARVRFDEIWILSLPAFRWFKADYNATRPRMGHTCHVVGNRQLLSIGGVDPSQSDLVQVWKGPDEFNQGLGIFDLSTLTWQGSYNANAAAYVRPDVVKTYYDKNGPYPNTWDQVTLKTLIQDNTTSTANASTNSTTDSTSTSTLSKSTSKPGPSHVGAIAGGVVGGIVFIILVVLGTWLLLRRGNRSLGVQTPEEMDGKSTGHQELPTDIRLGELDGDQSKAQLAVGQPKVVEMEGSSWKKIVHEMPVEISR